MPNYQMADSFMDIFGFKRVEETMPNHFDIIDFDPQTHELGCASCAHSRWHPTQFGGGLWCETHNRAVEDSCDEFSYEPGTDAD